MKKIQMVDLQTQYQHIKADIDRGIEEVIASAAFIKGPKVAEFQQHLEQYTGAKHVIPVGNGTDALQILERHGYLDAQKSAATVVRDCTTWHDYPVKGADGVFRGAFPEKGNTLANALDHVFADGSVNLLRHEVDAAADALDVSDHCPVIVDFSLKTCAQKK